VIGIRTGVKIADAMTARPVSVEPDLTIEECARVMLTNHVGSLVIQKARKLMGIITEQDIVRKVVAKKMNPAKTRVKDVMVLDIITAEPSDDIYDALVLMRDNNIRHLPVVHKGRLVGYLTIKDVLKIQPQLFEIIVEKFELREEQNKPLGVGPGEEVCEVCGLPSDRLYETDGEMCCRICRKKRK
jgi:signal-transduction protein with cAMP-binding, CBS, and nucleotidyltransferase domain